LLTIIIIKGYLNAVRSLSFDRSGALRLAFFVVALAYNFTEAGCRLLSPIWILFLFSGMAMPQKAAAAAPVAVPDPARRKQPTPFGADPRARQTPSMPAWQAAPAHAAP